MSRQKKSRNAIRRSSHKGSICPSYDRLDPRILLAGITYDSVNKWVMVEGSTGNDDLTVNQLNSLSFAVQLQTPGQTYNQSFNYANVVRIDASAGDGNDTFSVSVNVSAYLRGQIGDDTLTGGSANDILWGGAGNDSLNGGSGADSLNGGTGSDLHTGGAGDDYYFFDNVGIEVVETDTVVELANGGSDGLHFGTVTTSVTAQFNVAGSNAIVATHLDRTVKASSAAFLENIYGGTGNDSLKGSSITNYINGLGGNDVIWGLQGNDSLVGDAGNDSLNGGPGSDTLTGNAGDDYYFFESVGATETDTVVEQANEGSDGLNFGSVTTGVNATYNVAGSNVTVATHSFRTVKASSAAFLENIYGGTANDTLTGSSITNYIYGLGGNDVISGVQGDDYLFGDAGNDSLNGGTGDDVIWGLQGIDTLVGDAGNDSLNGGTEGDTLTGGVGDDYYFFEDVGVSEEDIVVEQANEGSDGLNFGSVTTGVNATYNVAGSNVIVAQHSNRTVKASSAAFLENIYGGTGNDSLTGSSTTNYIYGLGGDDVISGVQGNDYLFGDAGNDSFNSGAGDDTLTGGAGNDNYFFGDIGAAETDTVVEQANEGSDGLDFGSVTTGVTAQYNVAGSNAIVATHSHRTVRASNADFLENIYGSSGDDSLTGSSITNYIYGMGGNDVISGRGGNDFLFGEAGNDRLLGEAGIDNLNGGDGDDALIGGFTVDTAANEQDTLAGGLGNDRIYADRSGVNFSNGFYDGDLFFPDPGGLQDSIVDQQANDALLTFYSAQNGANWTDAEIQFFEETSFSWLQNVTGSSRILRDSLGNGLPLAFGRYAQGAVGGNTTIASNYEFFNGDRYITVNGDAAISLAVQSNSIVHEMAHNWDDAGETIAHGAASEPAHE
ncbi:MAG: calcium-binding protein [Pirellulaceae bacterium]